MDIRSIVAGSTSLYLEGPCCMCGKQIHPLDKKESVTSVKDKKVQYYCEDCSNKYSEKLKTEKDAYSQYIANENERMIAANAKCIADNGCSLYDFRCHNICGDL